MTFNPGDRLFNYEIVAEIGRGGMATVYRARQPQVNRDVAIKVLPPSFAQNDTLVRRFQQEAQVIAQLEHIHVLPVYDFGRSNDLLYIVMRYIPTGTLADRIKRQGALSPTDTIRIIEQLASALDYAHRRGIIHRDLKPGNVFLDSSDNVLLGDFGIARVTEASRDLTGTGNKVMGTPAYISPEQARGEREIDGRADQYSLGIIAYELLTGQRPFRATTAMSLVLEHINSPLPDPRELRTDLPPEVYNVLRIACAKDANRRYSSCTAFAKSLSTALQRARVSSSETTTASSRRPAPPPDTPAYPPSSSISDTVVRVRPQEPVAVLTPTPTPTPTPAPRRRRPWWLIFLLLVLFLLVAGGAGAAYLYRGELQAILLPPTPQPPGVELIEPTSTTLEFTLGNGPLVLTVRSQAERGLAYTLFYVNDELRAVSEIPTGPPPTEQESTFEWQPTAPGEYTLRIEAVAIDSTIGTSTIAVAVLDAEPETTETATTPGRTETPAPVATTPAPQATTAVAATNTPTPTATATQQPTATNTLIPTRTPTTSGPRSVDGTFTASRTNITPGQSVTLTWDLKANQAFIFSVVLVELNISSGNPQQTTLASGVGQTSGSRVVAPTENTTYRLDIFYDGSDGSSKLQQKSVTITVSP